MSAKAPKQAAANPARIDRAYSPAAQLVESIRMFLNEGLNAASGGDYRSAARDIEAALLIVRGQHMLANAGRG
ncbi:hypothetical protein [Zavarzinella formosa]|uniref:hypothetical protein n=1 Tax=Zavarzinella formosa TaxID=360055 RepID=UPI0002E5914F|nr:hypothetical protein [Zavarzinella formosa]